LSEISDHFFFFKRKDQILTRKNFPKIKIKIESSVTCEDCKSYTKLTENKNF